MGNSAPGISKRSHRPFGILAVCYSLWQAEISLSPRSRRPCCSLQTQADVTLHYFSTWVMLYLLTTGARNVNLFENESGDADVAPGGKGALRTGLCINPDPVAATLMAGIGAASPAQLRPQRQQVQERWGLQGTDA
ncbi:unnamed protein product [Natator depressus]